MLKRMLFMVLFGSIAAFAGTVKEVDSSNFQEETRSGLVLVDFYGKWCGPCQRLAPVLEKVASNMQGKVKIVKVETTQSKNLADSYHIEGVPTLILFKNGKEIDRIVGYRDQNAIENFISKR